MNDARGEASLEPPEHERPDVDREHREDDPAQPVEVDADSGDRVRPAQQVRERVVPGGPLGRDRLIQADPCWQSSTDDALEDHVRGSAENLRSADDECDRRDAQMR